jgi:23S rRNA (cytidine1920-2'-O)/16S rRNA (cytidine1409-2'-O)-methyltransferase
MKSRLDKLLVDRNLAQSRQRAHALILAGRVLVDEQKIDKPGTPVHDASALRLLGDDLKFVGRGGLKLERALEHWAIDVANLACADIGASTGGFTDCMLQRGASSVLAVDTGYGQIAQKLRADPRVSLLERTNARLLEPHSLAAPGIRFFAMDVSFISATLVLPAVLNAFAPPDQPWSGQAVILVKPQFEAGREFVGKGGIVRDPAGRRLAIDRVIESARSLGAANLDLIDSPIRGMEGNHEYLLRATFAGNPQQSV